MKRHPYRFLCAAIVACAAMSTQVASHAQYVPPKQVIVSVKIIEFQATKGLETGLSAYFKKLRRPEPFGRITPNGNAINSADLTFPSSTASGLTVFLDRISLSEGDIEVVLQALVDENEATILFRPRAMVPLDGTPTKINTTEMIPYESTQVVGATSIQIVEFKATGITLEFSALEAIDDDGNPRTKHDTFIHLKIDAQVREEGQRIVVALDDLLASGAEDQEKRITVPEFIERKIITEVWVPEGRVLMLGGLYRNTESKSLSTLPWLRQGENIATGLVDRIIPGNPISAPLSATIGNRNEQQTRRELVFLIKVESWTESFSLGSDLGFNDADLFDLDDAESDLESEDFVTDIPHNASAEPAEAGVTP